jgi:hypothetical protein
MGPDPYNTVRAVRGLPFLEKDVDSVYGNPTIHRMESGTPAENSPVRARLHTRS